MARIVRFHQTGGPEVLRIEEEPPSPPGEGEVRITVKAIGLNRADCLFRQGSYLETPTFPSRLGYEAAGTVEAVGAGVTGLNVGDRVNTLPAFSMGKHGVYGDSVVVPSHAVSLFPGNLSFEEGASIWVAYLTSYGALVEHGGLRKGQYVLITAASSSVGFSAIQVVRAAGGVSIATTRKPEKSGALRQAGADHVIVTGKEDLAARVMEITGGRGADLIFDPVAGRSMEALAAAAAQGATIFVYGVLSMKPTVFPLETALKKGLSLRGYTLFEIVSVPERMERARQYIFDGLKSGALWPVIDRIFPLESVVEAHRYMESNQQNGKIVITV
ncbi:MAG: zinc-dependent alcohol dehydrogenase family protein [Deltaproteobacteria bacterium]|uniref:zinc-dependent alcohol dehydrogenase family protein n=1 Tax=Candidatus Deferrimicrobium sp. TaxID=3060586 RepID=UPI00271A0B7C|nr:zinc-dependent alcohol dehydrogenase family protein [Candidatus Deferrimicrobium sp.]MCR4309872.1 zinc-dependent alcohol dehydrogenase family protein [Deltaproteobacteria bacterium]MDO8739775.1 zinc-dependent alcohol dehydrogenase family protein [Candidatus Deferrimicrobium sp.]